MQHNGWGEVVPTAEQALQKGKRAGVACMATAWFDRYKRNVLNFIKETGMQGLETDGQCASWHLFVVSLSLTVVDRVRADEGYSCEDESGDHHHNGIKGAFTAQIESTLDFNVALKGLGVYQTGADAYAFSGANKCAHALHQDVSCMQSDRVSTTGRWNHADTDAFGRLPFWPRLTVGRMYVFDSTMNRVPASGQIGVNDLSASSLACGAAGTAARMHCFDFALASGFGYGTIPSFRSAKLWDPADADAAKIEACINKWVGFFKSHRLLFASGSMLHIRRPDSRGYEAIAYMQPSSSDSIVSVFNPSQEAIRANVTVPLYYSGLAHGSTVNVATVALSTGTGGGAAHVVGQEGKGMFDIVLPCELPPASYAIFKLTSGA